MKKAFALGATFGVVLLLSGCGGGGGGSGSGLPVTAGPVGGAGTTGNNTGNAGSSSGNPGTPTPAPDPDAIVVSSKVAARCDSPRSGKNPATGTWYPDHYGSLANEKQWVRSWIDETYLWFDEIPPSIKSSGFSGPIPLFDALRSPGVSASGKPKDRFHFTYDTAAWQGQSADSSIGYGIEFAFLSSLPPYDLRVAYVGPQTQAAKAGVARGDRLISADGVDAVNGTDTDTLNAAIAPASAGKTHALTFRRVDGTSYTASLASSKVQMAAVMNVKAIDTPTGRVGYMQFNTHSEPAEAQLINAVNTLKAEQISDLVLDLRYNGGGLLMVANELASMIAAPAATNGKVFEKLQFNRKNPFRFSDEEAKVRFVTQAVGYSATQGQALPQLGLPRVTVLSGPDTCSASESIVNSLRGVGIPVDLVGGPTCGKPYGFIPQDNCGTTYFAIQFEGVNARGEGGYGDGFAPTCAVADDFSHALGDPAEARLAAALQLRATGACPVPAPAVNKSASARDSKAVARQLDAETLRQPYLLDSPARQNRIVDLRHLAR